MACLWPCGKIGVSQRLRCTNACCGVQRQHPAMKKKGVGCAQLFCMSSMHHAQRETHTGCHSVHPVELPDGTHRCSRSTPSALTSVNMAPKGSGLLGANSTNQGNSSTPYIHHAQRHNTHNPTIRNHKLLCCLRDACSAFARHLPPFTPPPAAPSTQQGRACRTGEQWLRVG